MAAHPPTVEYFPKNWDINQRLSYCVPNDSKLSYFVKLRVSSGKKPPSNKRTFFTNFCSNHYWIYYETAITKTSLDKFLAISCKNSFSRTYSTNVGGYSCIETLEPHGTPYEIIEVKVDRVLCKMGQKNREIFGFFEYFKGSPIIPKIGHMYLKVL